MELTTEQALAVADRRYHHIPSGGYTVGQAHDVMRRHLECRSWLCPAKGYALDVLVLEGRIHPDYEQYEDWKAQFPVLTGRGESRLARRLRRLARA